MEDKIRKAAAVLSDCKYVVVLTGAGISTESGIPDFRSPENGLWTKADPEDFTIQRFMSHPRLLYENSADFFKLILDAGPNEAHRALGDLEVNELVKSVITQNIDGLHQKGGSRNVLEIHGSLRSGSCVYCRHEETMEELINDVMQGLIPPLCKKCGEAMKPDVTLFGEAMPPSYQNALDEARKADGMLVVGSSLLVSPANMLPRYIDNLVIVNRDETIFDDMAGVVINESITEAVPALKEAWMAE